MIFKNILLLSLAMASFISCTSNSSGVKAITTVSAIVYIDCEDLVCNYHKLFKYDPVTRVNAIIPGTYEVSNYGYDNVTMLPTYNGVVYFEGGDQSGTEHELWKYDLRTNAVSFVADLYTGNTWGGLDFSRGTAFIGSKLYFNASDATNGYELWVYDTTLAVSATNPKMVFNGTTAVSPTGLTAINGKLYFSCNNAGDRELCEYDPNTPDSVSGALSGATNPKFFEIRITGPSNPYYFVGINGFVYFRATTDGSNYEVFKYDGTTATIVTEADTSGSASSQPEGLKAQGNKLVYISSDALGDRGLYTYDTSTPLVNATLIDLCVSCNEDVEEIAVTATSIYAAALGASNYDEIFEVTGNSSRVISPLTTGFYPTYLRILGGDLYFLGFDPLATNNNGYAYVFKPTEAYNVGGVNPYAFNTNDFDEPSDFALVQYSL